MRRLKLFISTAAVMMLSPLAMVSAQTTTTGIAAGADLGPLQDLMSNIVTVINNVIVPFIFGVGFLVFVWGMFKFFVVGGANEEAKEQGKSLMVYATLGFVLMIVFWGVVNLIADSTGVQNDTITAPKASITIP
jgi:hypothetical protein